MTIPSLAYQRNGSYLCTFVLRCLNSELLDSTLNWPSENSETKEPAEKEKAQTFSDDDIPF